MNSTSSQLFGVCVCGESAFFPQNYGEFQLNSPKYRFR